MTQGGEHSDDTLCGTDDAPDAASRIDHAGASLCVRDTGGSMPALVALHAGVCDQRMWAAQVHAWRGRWRTVTYDRRGYGRTRCQPQSHSPIEDCLAVMDALALRSAVLVGCSQGGRIALDTALAHPQRVRALVLVASAVTGAPDPAADLGGLAASRLAQMQAARQRGDLAAVNELQAQLWLDGPEEAAGRVGAAIRQQFLAMNALALAAPEVGPARAVPSAWARLEQLTCPVALVWGTLDFAHLTARMREMSRRLPAAQVSVLPGAAHLPNLERPQAFNAALDPFLGALG